MKSELKHEIIHVQKCKGIPMNPIEDSFNNFRLKNVTNDEIEASRKRVFKFLKEFNYIKWECPKLCNVFSQFQV